MTDVPFGKKIRYPYTFKTTSGGAATVDGTPAVAATLGVVVETVAGANPGEWSTLIDPQGVGDGEATGTADVDLGSGVKELAFKLGSYKGLESPEATLVEVGQPTIE